MPIHPKSTIRPLDGDKDCVLIEGNLPFSCETLLATMDWVETLYAQTLDYPFMLVL